MPILRALKSRFSTSSADTETVYVWGLRASALIEMLLFFALVLLVDGLMGGGNRFSGISPHPFWIIVLLVSAQYGVNEALLCALLATVCLIAGNMPEQQFSETHYDYWLRVVYQPFLWLSTALIIGGLRTRQMLESDKLQDAAVLAEERTETIAGAYSKLKLLKENLEVRLAEELRSVLTVFNAAKALETLDRRDILQAIERLVRLSLNPGKFSIYTKNDEALELILSHGWLEGEIYRHEVTSDMALYQEVVSNKLVLSIANEHDQRILANQGIMAGPIIDTNSGQVLGMLKIEEGSVAGFTLRNRELFRILCEWIGAAWANLRQYERARENSYAGHMRGMLAYRFLQYQGAYVSELAKQFQFNIYLVGIIHTNAGAFSERDRTTINQMMMDNIHGVLHRKEQLFEGPDHGEFVITVPCLAQQEAEEISHRIKKRIAELNHPLMARAQFNFSVQPLFEPIAAKEASYAAAVTA